MSGLSPLIRVSLEPKEVARGFATWSKSVTIMTKGRVRVGYNKKTGMRGLFANMDIKQSDILATVPTGAMISAVTAMKDKTFTSMFESSSSSSSGALVGDIAGPNFPIQKHNVMDKCGGQAKGFVLRQHLTLGLYMSHVHLTNDEKTHAFLPYLNFLPRGEAVFAQMQAYLGQLIQGDPEVREWVTKLSKRHYLSFEDTTGVLLYFMTMLYSRSVPVGSFSHVAAIVDHTPLVDQLRVQQDMMITAMVPIIDMCNHDPVENACVVGPNAEFEKAEYKYLGLQALKPMKAGDEILVTYGTGSNPDELTLLYGIERKL